ncbi:MAG: NAD(P)/FAD-dependent oxidoreductase [Clostridiales bacterium]|jgi:flavin-dependent dehydrogenase|nr:NAD(P)/FAD-dependent oxidoreductase [Clostridiales bacterium]
MKIIIIGAGEGGLTAAYELAKNNHDVTIYEKAPRENLGYDWNDTISLSTFGDLGIPQPDLKYCVPKRDWVLIAPDSDAEVRIPQNPAIPDFRVQRRHLKDLLIGRAEEVGVKFLFRHTVDRLIFDGLSVKGAIVGSLPIFADLVIDASGVFSPFRASLPRNAGFTAMPSTKEVFYSYRAICGVNEGEKLPEYFHCYVKCIGKIAIGWYIYDEMTGLSDVMFCMSERLSESEAQEAFAFIRKKNPILADNVVVNGKIIPIPVRYPASKFVLDGYALVGDSAFMTMPLMGSGIGPSMRAGKMLADTVNEKNSVTTESLWDYQVKFFTEIGSKHVQIDIFKRWLLSVKEKDLKFLMESGIITEKDINAAAEAGAAPKISFYDILQKIGIASRNIVLFSKLGKMLLIGKTAMDHAAAIPTKYNPKTAAAWSKKLDDFMI